MSTGRVLHKGQLEAKLRDENQLIRSGLLRDENPLDLSDQFGEFIFACRQGDLATCQRMVSEGVNINGKDKFDYTPLIIASLCGHYELVRLLLESGALAERNTFQGERCIYNALNDNIRNLLLKYDYSKGTDPLQSWSSHIQSLMHRETPKISDVSLLASTASFDLHKFLLSLRSPYFLKKFQDSPASVTCKLPDKIPVESVRHVLRYLYLGDPPKDLVDPDSTSTEAEVLAGIDKISKYLRVEQIWDTIFTGFEDRRLARQRFQDEVNRAQSQVEEFVNNHVLPAKMVINKDKAENVRWKFNNPTFADMILRADQRDHPDHEIDQEEHSSAIPIGPVTHSRPDAKAVLYPVHKAFLIRCPYFDVMFSSEFAEAQPSEHLRITTVDCSPETLEVIIKYMYTEKFNCPLEIALDVLYTADMLLFDTLKGKAAATISNLGSGSKNAWEDRSRTNAEEGDSGHHAPEVEPVNIYDVIRAAWDLNVQRLENFAGRYLAYRLEDYIDEDDFAALIKESAERVKDRQETDTIELLDDIRYFLSERFRMRFEDAGLDDMLEDEIVEVNPESDVEREFMNGVVTQNGKQNTGQTEVDTIGGAMRTLDGQLVEDEFDSDALNYRILLQKIDNLLDNLKLDA
ncbi:BTB/POZ domain-containing protein [Zalerion maritima]|uniref:BTB/POZ domain-containing protein n=1 Tax=Zalerion maritima TaxID=339359 RepID=A0AAD5WPC9_9PEZI|nr:BTB/POZ domain-containing protein [Zalerion maritima]